MLTIIYNVTLESVTTTDPATGETKVVPGGVEEKNNPEAAAVYQERILSA